MLHIPVDRQTLRFLYSYPNYRHLTVEDNGKFTSWKWDLEESVYLKIQNCLRDLAKVNGYEEAMHLEMDKIWTQPTSKRSGL